MARKNSYTYIVPLNPSLSLAFDFSIPACYAINTTRNGIYITLNGGKKQHIPMNQRVMLALDNASNVIKHGSDEFTIQRHQNES